VAAASAVAACGVAACAGGDRRDAGAVRVVRVSVAGAGLVPEVATGVAAGDGRVLTVAHVLAAGGAPTVLGRPAPVLRVDRRADLALLRVPGLRAPRLRPGNDAAGTVAVRVLRDGRPRTLHATVRRHVTARVHATAGDRPLTRPGLELAAGVDPGDSGAPVLDASGHLLGVVFARTSDSADTAWAVDASAAQALLR
jgi:S1-C subfamily serine protease